jgi:hypothetical protein
MAYSEPTTKEKPMERTEAFDEMLRTVMEEDRQKAIGQLQGTAVAASFVLIGVAIGLTAHKIRAWINKNKSNQAIKME